MMLKHKANVREMVGMVLCTLLSLAALLLLVVHGESLPAVLALVISLACPVAWLALLLWEDRGGGGLVQRVRCRVVLLRQKAESEWISR